MNSLLFLETLLLGHEGLNDILILELLSLKLVELLFRGLDLTFQELDLLGYQLLLSLLNESHQLRLVIHSLCLLLSCLESTL